VWVPLLNDCNNAIDDALRDGGGDPSTWADPPFHWRLGHDIVTLRILAPAWARLDAVVRQYAQWVAPVWPPAHR
jgi:hypothetical protein